MRPSLTQTISIKMLPSKLMLGLIMLVSIISCVILWFLPILLAIKLAAMSVVLLSSVYYSLRDALLLLPWSWQSLEVNSKAQLIVINKRGRAFLPALHESTFVHAKLCILNFKSEPFKLGLPPVVLLSNAQNLDEIRRLRVWLKWTKSKGRDATAPLT